VYIVNVIEIVYVFFFLKDYIHCYELSLIIDNMSHINVHILAENMGSSFYNYWLDLIRVTYLFYNCLCSVGQFFREIRNHLCLLKKKSVGLFRWTKSLGTYYFLKKNS